MAIRIVGFWRSLIMIKKEKQKLQNFNNYFVMKNTRRVSLMLMITLATVGCSASSSGGPQTGGPQTGSFPYVCPNGTPTAGMVATENTISCETCTTTGFKRIGTRCATGCSGTAVATVADLTSLGDSGKTTGDFHLTNDIDLTGVTWNPKDFNGCLNGVGYVIRNLRVVIPIISRSGGAPKTKAGLFSQLGSSAVIENVGLEDIQINGSMIGGLPIAADVIVGSFSAENDGMISTSYAHGEIDVNIQTSPASLKKIAGGLVGINRGEIRESYAHVSIDGRMRAGGLVGQNLAGTIENSFATGGALSLINNMGGRAAGLVSLQEVSGNKAARIIKSYTIANRAESMNQTGGLVAFSESAGSTTQSIIEGSFTATRPLRSENRAGLVYDANGVGNTIDSSAFNGKNYYLASNGVSNGIGEGTCASSNCIQATGATLAARRNWLANTLNKEDALGWSSSIWNNHRGGNGWPCLQKIADTFSGRDGCPPMAPLICPGGTARAGNAVTGTVDCLSCDASMGYKLVGSECLRFESVFSRVGSAAAGFGVSEDIPRDLASIGNTLYMVGSRNEALYRLDTDSGEATRVNSSVVRFGVVSPSEEHSPFGLASIRDTLYMVGDANDALYTLNTSSGMATRVGSADQFGVDENNPTGLASIGNTLYMVGENAVLYRLDTDSGEATRVGSAAAGFGVGENFPEGLASIGNTLYMVGDARGAYRLDTDSGEATRVGTVDKFGVGENTPAGLASIGNTLYMVGLTNTALHKAEVP